MLAAHSLVIPPTGQDMALQPCIMRLAHLPQLKPEGIALSKALPPALKAAAKLTAFPLLCA